MSSMISGKDVIFHTPRHGFELRLVLDAVLDFWPDARYQYADEDGILRLDDRLAEPSLGEAREFFVYQDDTSAAVWERDGWTEAHGDAMLHFLLVEDGPSDAIQLTLVIGSVTGELVRLVGGVYEALQSMANNGRCPPRRSRRIQWDKELQAVGYTQGRESFSAKVEELRAAVYPEWSAEELACHPHEAQHFCDIVRRLVAPVPDHLVMKALLGPRTRPPGASEPRLQWA